MHDFVDKPSHSAKQKSKDQLQNLRILDGNGNLDAAILWPRGPVPYWGQ